MIPDGSVQKLAPGETEESSAYLNSETNLEKNEKLKPTADGYQQIVSFQQKKKAQTFVSLTTNELRNAIFKGFRKA